MTAYVALLRAVNVGGRSVPMAELREAVARLGLRNVRTVLQSGNLLFEADGATPEDLELRIESAVESRFGLVSETMVRNSDEWRAIVRDNPFPGEAEADPAHLVLMVLKSTVPDDRIEALRKAVTGREYLKGQGRAVYLVYPDGIGRSKLTAAVVERHLGAKGTGRNWNSVHRLLACMGQNTA